MKSGLLLTLKQLIKLGVINLKKKRRRRPKRDSTQKSPFQQGVNSIDTQGMGPQRYKDFLSASSAPNPQAYSDPLRLRDETRDLQTRLMEQKNQQEIQNVLLENQRIQQENITSEIEKGKKFAMGQLADTIWAESAEPVDEGYSNKDNFDVAKTEGSRGFKSQKLNEPNYEETGMSQGFEQPEERPSGTSRYSDVEEGFVQSEDEGFTNPPYEERQNIVPQQETKFPALTYQGETRELTLPEIKDLQVVSTRIPMRNKSTIRIKGLPPPEPMPKISTFGKPELVAEQRKEGAGGGSSMADTREPGLSDEFDEFQQEQKAKQSGGNLRSSGASLGFPNVPNIPAPEEPNLLISQIKITNKKPTKEEIRKLRQFYILLGLNNEKVLASNKRDDYVTPILLKLKNQYLSLDGTDQEVLKSKNPRVIYEAIRTKQGY
jgi:hypothetical protein